MRAPWSAARSRTCRPRSTAGTVAFPRTAASHSAPALPGVPRGARRRIGWLGGGRPAAACALGDHGRVVSTDGAQAPRTVRREGVLASWEPSPRLAVPVIVLLVNVANLVGVGTVVLLLFGVDDGSDEGRLPVLLTAAAYLLVAFPVGTWAGLRRQRGTNAWLLAGRRPDPTEAAQALRIPVDTALIAGSIWLVGAVLVGSVAAASFPDPRIGLRIGVAVVLGGMVTAGVTYLLVARAARDVAA